MTSKESIFHAPIIRSLASAGVKDMVENQGADSTKNIV
jgi:hypothetical protein